MHKNSRAIELCPDPRNVQAFRSLGARVKLLQHVQKVGARQAKDIVEQVAIACENSIDEVEYRPRGQELVIPQVSMQQDIKDFFTNFRDLQQIEIYGKLRLTVCSLIGNEERSVGLGSDQPSQ